MRSIILGADPGIKGGLAVITPKGVIAVKMPETIRDLQEFFNQLTSKANLPIVAYLEMVASRPEQGVKSMFTFGRNYGNLEAAIMFSDIRLERVASHKWQGFLRCRTAGDKNVTKKKAQELFPRIKITHAVADALLIAEYGRRVER